VAIVFIRIGVFVEYFNNVRIFKKNYFNCYNSGWDQNMHFTFLIVCVQGENKCMYHINQTIANME
jgi:hypothetical protein